MGKLTFRGGIHPYEGKELSKDHPIEKYLPKGDLVYPLSQHIGAPSVPCVKKCDTVLSLMKVQAFSKCSSAGSQSFFQKSAEAHPPPAS